MTTDDIFLRRAWLINMALITCPECGEEISDKAISCPHCGVPLNVPKEEYLCCPYCGSKELSSNKKGFSGGKALAGAIAVGGIGLLAGTHNSSDIVITCLQCGHKFKPKEAKTVVIDPNVKSEEYPEEKDAEIIGLLLCNERMEAIKAYKNKYNVSTSEAFDWFKDKSENFLPSLTDDQKTFYLSKKPFIPSGGNGCMVALLMFLTPIASIIGYGIYSVLA